MRTYTLTVDAIGDDEPITVQNPAGCEEIEIYENAQAATLDLRVRAPERTSPQVTVPAGRRYIFRPTVGKTGRFQYGETVGYVSVPSGSLTLVQEERG